MGLFANYGVDRSYKMANMNRYELTDNNSNFEQAETAEARSGAYRLFAHLLAGEPDGRWLDFLRSNSSLLPGLEIPEPEKQPQFIELLQVEYTRLFLLNLYPYQSVFGGAEPLLNTLETEKVQDYFFGHGFSVERVKGRIKNLLPDHLAVEMRFMAYLAKGEALAWREAKTETALNLAQAAHSFLQDYLLKWLPVLALAVPRISQNNFYRILIAQTLAFTLYDFRHLQEQGTGEGKLRENAAKSAAKNETLILDLAQERLPEIVNYLTTPARSGFFLTKIEIERLAQRLRLPPSGENRFQMFRALFEQAAQYEVLADLLTALSEVTGYYAQELAKLTAEFPACGAVLAENQTKIKATENLLQAMQSQANTVL
jgi:putative dimethyl sulfoxide reductase chaperone